MKIGWADSYLKLGGFLQGFYSSVGTLTTETQRTRRLWSSAWNGLRYLGFCNLPFALVALHFIGRFVFLVCLHPLLEPKSMWFWSNFTFGLASFRELVSFSHVWMDLAKGHPLHVDTWTFFLTIFLQRKQGNVVAKNYDWPYTMFERLGDSISNKPYSTLCGFAAYWRVFQG